VFIIVVCLSVLVSACKLLVVKKYKFNQKFDFTTKAAYFGYLKEKKKFNLEDIIYPDSASVVNFFASLSLNKITVYYGCLVNDSVELKKSELLKENLSCAGRILADIRTRAGVIQRVDSNLVQRSGFHRYRFRSLVSGRVFNLNNSEKKFKILLVYGHSLGTYFDDYYREVYRYYQKYKNYIELYIITLDPVGTLSG